MKPQLEEKYTVEVLYLGESADVFGHIRQVFRDKKGKIYNYAGVIGAEFGECYMVSKTGSIHTRPERIKKSTLVVTEQDRLDYEANKEIAKYTRLKKRKALQLKKPHPNIVRALDLLKPFTRNMDHLNLKRFTDYIENQLSKKSKK